VPISRHQIPAVLLRSSVASRACLLALLFGLLVPVASGQTPVWKQRAQELAPLPSLVSNSVQVLDAAGDSLWSGPLLTLYLEAGDRPQSSDSLLLADVPAFTEQDNVAFSIEARTAPGPALVWAGLAFDAGGGEPGAGGFLVSSDGGATFEQRGSQLDRADDTTLVYGTDTLSAVPVVQEAGSPPQDLAFGAAGDTVWVAGLRSGIRWTADQGSSWTRTVLPPDTSGAIDPTTPTDILVGPRLEDGRGWLNHIGYSVLVDETGTVWAGTASGVNWSAPRDGQPTGRRAWRRATATDSVRRLTGNVVVALAEQPRPGGRNSIWMATWAGQRRPGERLQRFGVTVTSDGGESFRQTLIGERIFDLAARPSVVYAAGETGLFVSIDRGETWRSVERFPLLNDDQALPSNASVQGVAVSDAALWVGTSEGLLRLDRSREERLIGGTPSWQLLRTETPVNPDEPSEQVPDVATYAYPNPFVPSRDELVRITYELDESGPVEVTIYDFGMNRVRTLSDQKPAGQQETIWRGRDEQGLRVPTGTYFYTVDLGGRTVKGKILVAN
jgi:hypothetical protein